MLDTQKRNWLTAASIVIGIWTTSACQAAWFDSNWQYRRGISITWDDQNPGGNELGTAVFYTDGHALPNGDDVRVATEDGRLVASHVLMAGPGDRIRVVFALQKNVRDYEIYFGNPHPQPPPEGMDDVKYKAGLLLETKQWTGGAVDNFNQIENSWQRSNPLLGKMMTDSVFIGYNPFGIQEQWISKFTGSLFAPLDGEYQFAAADSGAAAVYIDGKPVLYAPRGGADIRYNAKVTLTRGPHDILVYQVSKGGGQGYVSLGWRPPDTAKVVVINRESFGICYSGLVGLMEQHGKTLVADFSSNQTSECFLNDGYVYHYHFSTRGKSPVTPGSFRWDFGDGQVSDQPEVDHVYLTDGIYAVKLTGGLDGNTDTQTCQLPVTRNYAHILDVHEEPPADLSTIVQSYELAGMSAEALNRAIQLEIAGEHLYAAIPFADKVAAMPRHPVSGDTLAALASLQKKLIDADQVEKMVEIWDRVPAGSDLQPSAARNAAELAMWWTGDFDKAVKLLKPYQDRTDQQIRQTYGQALVLSGNAEQGRKILDGINLSVPANRRAALSGAAARSVEFFITEKDAESGEDAWDRWQMRFPTDFLEGYSVVLRTKLMELRHRPEAAAKVAEAFATAQPQSPYAPQLLDRASKLLASADPTKSQALRQLLKQKYPEDPLSQN